MKRGLHFLPVILSMLLIAGCHRQETIIEFNNTNLIEIPQTEAEAVGEIRIYYCHPGSRNLETAAIISDGDIEQFLGEKRSSFQNTGRTAPPYSGEDFGRGVPADVLPGTVWLTYQNEWICIPDMGKTEAWVGGTQYGGGEIVTFDHEFLTLLSALRNGYPYNYYFCHYENGKMTQSHLWQADAISCKILDIRIKKEIEIELELFAEEPTEVAVQLLGKFSDDHLFSPSINETYAVNGMKRITISAEKPEINQSRFFIDLQVENNFFSIMLDL